MLRYFSGLSHEQIATVLGISPQAVHGRLFGPGAKWPTSSGATAWEGVSHESAGLKAHRIWKE